jgi:hypothetical protein
VQKDCLGKLGFGEKLMRTRVTKKRSLVRANADFLVRHFLAKARTGVKKSFSSNIARSSTNTRQLEELFEKGNWQDRLSVLAALEESDNAAPPSVGLCLEKALIDAPSRKELSAAAFEILPQFPDSAIVIYAYILGLLDDHRFEAAHTIVSQALMRQCTAMLKNESALSKIKKQVKRFSALWKIVDSAARDQMQWITPPVVGTEAYHDLDFVRKFESLPKSARPQDYEITLAFAEPYLQGRQNAKYLAACELAFAEAITTFQKLRAIRAMWRQGFRRIPDYCASYDQARICYATLRPEISQLISFVSILPSRELIRLLRSAYSVCKHLELHSDAQEIRSAMLTGLNSRNASSAAWVIANVLSNESSQDPRLHRWTEQLIVGDQDWRDFFQWAASRGKYEIAQRLFEELPHALKSQQQHLSYVNILQRSQLFDEAESLVHSIHANMLSNLHELDYYASFGLIRRAGELKFVAQTARYYSSIPQPSNPVGIIFATPRNIEQLRRTPIVVLMEWKKLGWAVIPLFEGVLPLEKTGHAAIDQFAGCIRSTNRLREDFVNTIGPQQAIVIDASAQALRWRDIDLSHAAWEEAAISRRTYSPNWNCPALKRSIGLLGTWSEHLGNVMDFARTEFSKLGLRTGIHVFFNFRLPDAIVRFYCEKYGDPKDFFCIHASNGYENYFSNFEQNQSSNMSIRNMTAHPETRSCAFPTMQMLDDEMLLHSIEFDSFAQENFERRRLSSTKHLTSPGAKATRLAVKQWQKKGGRVAVAFGKVVCDSGVPFDGGPCHHSMRDWINHTIECVSGSNTLLLIKPHPHEKREEIASFMNQTFRDLITCALPENVIYLDHDWFEMTALMEFVDLALIYNSTAAIEMASMYIPTVVCSHFAPIDYPVGHTVPKDREDYRRLIQFERPIVLDKAVQKRAATWLNIMRTGNIAIPYRFHTRQITNKVAYPPKWFEEEINQYLKFGNPNVTRLAEMAIRVEPDSKANGFSRYSQLIIN